MRAECSRADLLRVLHGAPGVPAATLAAALGWDGAEPLAGEPAPVPAQGVPAAAGAPVQYLVRPVPRYWRVVGCEPLEPDARPETPADEAGAESQAGHAATAPPPPDPRMPPLLTAGQWQNLWDRLPPASRRGRAIDLKTCLRRLTRAEPLRDPPRRPRRGFNRAVPLLVDRPDALRPAWDDLRLAQRTLAAPFGDELQAFLLPTGPDGPWIDRQPLPRQPGGAFAPPGPFSTRANLDGAPNTGTSSPHTRAFGAGREAQAASTVRDGANAPSRFPAVAPSRPGRAPPSTARRRSRFRYRYRYRFRAGAGAGAGGHYPRCPGRAEYSSRPEPVLPAPQRPCAAATTVRDGAASPVPHGG